MSESEQNPQKMRAAALKYNAKEDAAPIVVAAGNGHIAQKIVEVGDECGISIYHDDSAATLLSKLQLGQEVPADLYQMVVEIYLAVLTAAELADKIPLDHKSER